MKTSNNVQIFKSEVFGQVRTMTNAEGETFFVGRDVAKAPGYCNTRDALRKHVDDEDRGVAKCDTLGGTQKTSSSPSCASSSPPPTPTPTRMTFRVFP